jgi:hypothetical protein
VPNAATASQQFAPGHSARHFPEKLMKKLVPYLITAGVAIVAVKFIYPLAQPYLAKIPVVGSFFTA